MFYLKNVRFVDMKTIFSISSLWLFKCLFTFRSQLTLSCACHYFAPPLLTYYITLPQDVAVSSLSQNAYHHL